MKASWVAACRAVGAFRAGKREGHGARACAASCSAAQTSGSPSGGPKPITMSSGRTIASSHGPKESKVERRQRALAHDHRMDELHRDMLGVGGVGSASKGEQTAAAQKASDISRQACQAAALRA